jgi:hypothetical protein
MAYEYFILAMHGQARQFSLLPGLVYSKLSCNGYTALSHRDHTVSPHLLLFVPIYWGSFRGEVSEFTQNNLQRVKGKLWDRKLSYLQFDTTIQQPCLFSDKYHTGNVFHYVFMVFKIGISTVTKLP